MEYHPNGTRLLPLLDPHGVGLPSIVAFAKIPVFSLIIPRFSPARRPQRLARQASRAIAGVLSFQAAPTLYCHTFMRVPELHESNPPSTRLPKPRVNLPARSCTNAQDFPPLQQE